MHTSQVGWCASIKLHFIITLNVITFILFQPLSGHQDVRGYSLLSSISPFNSLSFSTITISNKKSILSDLKNMKNAVYWFHFGDVRVDGSGQTLNFFVVGSEPVNQQTSG